MVVATYLTIWMALALFVLAEVGRAKGDRPLRGTGTLRCLSPFSRRARALSGAGLVLALVHTLLAFDVFHGWSHADAVLSTAQQTQRVFGVRFGAGVYVNYLFFAVWLVDAVLWRPALPASRGLWVIRAFYLLIIFNGAVVFAAGWRRVLGLLLVGVLLLAWLPRESFARRAAQ